MINVAMNAVHIATFAAIAGSHHAGNMDKTMGKTLCFIIIFSAIIVCLALTAEKLKEKNKIQKEVIHLSPFTHGNSQDYSLTVNDIRKLI